MKKHKILIVDDDERIRVTLSDYLRESGFEIVTAADCSEARRLNTDNISLALLDLQLPDGSGLELLQEFRNQFPRQLQVMISGQATLRDAVTAIKAGASDFLEKPLSPEKVELTLRNALRMARLSRKVASGEQESAERYQLVGTSPAITEVRQQIQAVASTNSSVLLLGESGTGKEVAARLIHSQSRRAGGPFIAVNTAAIPRELLESELFGHEKGAFTGATQQRIGKFEQADSGTIFLDEIAEMAPQLQAKLLRVLEDQAFERVGGSKLIESDFRLICATNQDLEKRVADGEFRKDLLFRINVFTIRMPPLRELKDDLEHILIHHLRRLSASMGKEPLRVSDELIAALDMYPFPGNVRELRNILERLLISHRGDELSAADLTGLLESSPASTPMTLKDATLDFEARYIGDVLRQTNGNMTEAAEILGLDRSYLYRKIKSLGIDEVE